MDIKDFKAGTLRKGYRYEYFMPEKVNHAFFWTDEALNELLEQASLRLGELNSFSRFVPSSDLFIKMYVYKEAVVSSRIEGTRTNMEEAIGEEKDVDPERRDDWQEVNNYVAAMNGALDQLRSLPLSNRLIRETHRILLSSGRGGRKTPGEFRMSQNWIGGASLSDAVFIPPAHEELPELMSDLELFLHNTDIRIPHLIRIAIAHYQFETIHPFLDGNGRVGRLLIALYLVGSGVMSKPLLYLSDFFERNKALYYDNLSNVRTKNDLGQWLKYFLVGVIQTAEAAAATLKNIFELKASLDGGKILSMGRRAPQAALLLNALFVKPMVTVNDVMGVASLSAKASNDLVKAFVAQGILSESTGRQRNRVYVFDEYMSMF